MAARPDPRHALGRTGEELAAAYLQRRGFRILDRCARTAAGELDVVAFARGEIVFVEVKTRRGRSARSADPLASIRPRTRVRLRRAGAAWLSEHRERPRARRIRFDAIGLTVAATGHLVAIEHVADAF